MRRVGWRDERDAATYYGEHLRFSVHGSIHAPGKWFVSCHDLGLSIPRELPGATTLEDAKVAAEMRLTERLQELSRDILTAVRTRTGA